MSERERVPYAVAAAASRHALAWAARQRPRLTPVEWATLAAVVSVTAGYSRLADHYSARQLAELAHASERRVRGALRELERRPGCPIVVVREPGKWLRLRLLDPGQQMSGVGDDGEGANPGQQMSGEGVKPRTPDVRGTSDNCCPTTPDNCCPTPEKDLPRRTTEKDEVRTYPSVLAGAAQVPRAAPRESEERAPLADDPLGALAEREASAGRRPSRAPAAPGLELERRPVTGDPRGASGSREPELGAEREGSRAFPSKAVAPRPPDPLWDALEAELGEVVTASERGRRNRALRELREVGATPEEITRRCRAYRERWPDVDLTASALAANWSLLARPVPRVRYVRPGDVLREAQSLLALERGTS